jgi:hypothetical protein
MAGINWIIKAIDIQPDQHPKQTPCKQGYLGADIDREPPHAIYNYRSIVGQVGYLKGHLCPYIEFAYSQRTRFSNNPKQSHEKALEHIGLYLKGTRKNGLILRPNYIDNLPIDCYVDADFAGIWGFEDKQDPTNVRSQTGSVIFVADCLVFWQTKLQTDITTYTMEAEYNALSMAMQDLLPLKNLLKKTMGKIGVEGSAIAKLRTTLLKYNLGALRLARLEPGRMIPRSKHYEVKYHWFRTKLTPNDGNMSPVASAEQRPDFLTKSLTAQAFMDNRKLTMGW